MWLQTFLLYIFYASLFLLPTIYVYFKYKYNYWAKNKVAYLEPSFPFGNIKSLILGKESLGNGLKRIYNELKMISQHYGGVYFFTKPALIILDPDIIKSILSTDFAHFADRSMFSDETSDPLSVHLVAMKGLRWKTLRAKMTPTFTSGKMKMMFYTILNTTNELGSILDKHINAKKPVDIRELVSGLATDTIASCAFGLDTNSLQEPDNEFRKFGKKVSEDGIRETIVNILANMIPGGPAVLKLFKIPMTNPDVTKFFMDILKQTIEHREKHKVVRKDFLDLLIRLKNKQSVLDDLDDIKEDETGISFNELAAQAFIFFLAGFETSSATLNFCFYELSCNQDIQERTRNEVNQVLAQYNDDISYDAVMEMKYMDKVFNEVLRKYPPIPVLSRECTIDYKMPKSDYICKKGTEIMITTLGLHRDPAHYLDPDKFDPERFSDAEKSKRHPFTYLPFGEGPRNCIGLRFGLLQVKIVLAMLIKDYKFSLHRKSKIPVEFDPKSIFLSPVDTIWLEISKISK